MHIPVEQRDGAGEPLVRVWAPRRYQTRKLSQYLNSVLGPNEYKSFGNTVGNARAAVKSRVTLKTPDPDPQAIGRLLKSAERLGRKLGGRLCQPWSDEEVLSWILSLPKKKKVRYLEAFESLKERPFCPEDSKVRCFVKSELTKPQPGKFYKPRMIQYRSARFLVHVARYLKPIEHLIYSVNNVFTRKSGPECAKSMDNSKRGKVLEQQAKNLRLAYFLSLDCSAFDAHVNTGLLEVEQAFYKRVASAAGWGKVHVGTFVRAMKMQLVNRVSGVFPDGKISYTVKGNRMSGDLNTACGNCLLFMLMISDAMNALVGKDAWTMLDDGDDCVVMMEGELYTPSFARRLVDRFRSYGMVLKIESCSQASDIENIEFCQSKPVKTSRGYVMVRNWEKVLSTVTAGVRWHGDFDDFRSFCAAVGVGDGIACRGVPVLQSWFSWVRRVAAEASANREVLSDTYRFWRVDLTERFEPEMISEETRMSFLLAFGLDTSEQNQWEELFDQLPTNAF